jgi:hypothetical protein
MNKTSRITLSSILGLIFLAIGAVYLTHTADTLPHWLPGFDTSLTTKHTKHGLAAILLGIISFVYAWFQSGPKSEPTK